MPPNTFKIFANVKTGDGIHYHFYKAHFHFFKWSSSNGLKCIASYRLVDHFLSISLVRVGNV